MKTPEDIHGTSDNQSVHLGILQNTPSNKTLKILRDSEIAVYHGLEPEEVEKALQETSEKLKERDQKEHE